MKGREAEQSLVKDDQENRWLGILEDHQDDRWRRRPQWVANGCWFVLLGHDECDSSGLDRWDRVAHGECKDRPGEDQ